MSEIKLRVLKVDQPIGEFYIGAITARKLIEISFTEIRHFIEGTQGELAGIQRDRSPKRIEELSKYVNFTYATFPTSIVLAIDEKVVEVSEVEHCAGLYNLTISSFDGSEDEKAIPLSEAAFIIDGQHRLAGLKGLNDNKEFDVNVSIFVGADMADKAEIFSRVNLAQTKVNRSLVYDLFSYAKTKSPHRMAHEVAIALNRDKLGPFYKKIKRLGKATPGLGKIETLAQATVVDGILKYISSDIEEERNSRFLGLGSPKRKAGEWKHFIFQPFYDLDDTVAVLQIMTNYFGAVEKKWPSVWREAESGMILNRTTGYNALMRFLRDAFLRVSNEPRVVSQDEFYEIFEPMRIEAGELNSEIYRPGGSGASALYRRLSDEMNR